MLVALLKRIPIDLGQGAVAETTEGKQIALRLVPPGSGRTALDIGCRQGHQTRWLRSQGYSVTPIDISKELEGCQIVDVNDGLPFADETFDLVWCSEVIEHLVDPAKSIEEMERVTKAGGDIVITTPNSYALLFRVLAVFGLTPQRIQRPDHLHFFGEPDIRRLFPNADIYGFFPYALVKYTIKRGVGHLSPTFVVHIRKPLGSQPEDEAAREE
jgi:SAM-dependent methyltransferase